MHRPVLLVGGSPRLAVDAIRYITVDASGTTAVQIKSLLGDDHSVHLLLSESCQPNQEAMRYKSRMDLENAIDDWLARHPDSLIVLTAAVNDYEIDAVSVKTNGDEVSHVPGSKIPSGADEIHIRLKPAAKLADTLKSRGHQGPLVLCKYEDAATVISSAQKLLTRTGASLVLANSLCGSVQALVCAEQVDAFPDRESVVAALAERIAQVADY